MRETKTRVSKLLVILISAGAVLMSAVPAFASSQSVGIPDRDVIAINQFSGSLFPNQSAYHIEAGTNELVIPVYINLTNFQTVYSETYLSGYIVYSTVGLNVFGSGTAPVNVSPEYFEGVATSNMQVSFTTAYSLKVYFDNFRINDDDNNARTLFLGYMHYTFDEPSSAFWYQFPNANVQVNATGGVMYGSAYEYGFADSIIYALDTATSVQDMLDILNDIDQNTGYLPDIFTELQTRLPQLYSLIQQIFNTDQAILSVNQDTYRTILSILAILQDAYGVQESHAEEVAEDIEQNMSNLAHDIELTKPSAVANIADDYISQIDTSYNASIFGSLFNPIVILMLCVVFAFAILSYMLYGGQ